MKIGVDSRPLREKQTSGIPMYVRNVLRELSRLDSHNEYVLYAHKDIPFELPSDKWSKRFGAKTNFGSVWMQAELPFWLIQDNIDLFWGTQHILPIFMPSSIKSVLTIHDLVHYVFPETMRPLNYLINKFVIPPSVKRADAIVSISEWTMKDVKRFLNPSATQLEVIHNGISPVFTPGDVSLSKKNVKRVYGINEPYILTVGTFEPRKNVINVFRSFEKIADKIPHSLVIVGQKGWKNNNVMNEIMASPIQHRIRRLGYVEDEIIPDVYRAADVFVFPSLYEGFGIPPLEAMACGIPVVASNVSSIPEVLNGAAHLVNPMEAGQIADGILRVLNETAYRTELVSKGTAQSNLFKWSISAEKLLRVFNSLN